MNAPRVIHPTGAVTVEDFFRYLQRHRKQWPVARIARIAKVPRSVVYNALNGGNVTVETLSRITRVLGAQVFVVIGTGENRLRP